MKKNRVKTLLIVGAALSIFGCVDNDNINDPRGSKTVPNVPENIVVRDIPGGAVLKYKLNHAASNIRYVKAEVKDVEGNVKYFHSSIGVDSLLIEGLLSTGKYDVKLYSINYSDTPSEALSVSVSPAKAPIEVASISEIRASFSSVRVMYRNPTEEKLFIGLTKKINGHWQQMGMPYAGLQSGSVYITKQEDVEAEYGAYFYDKWGHRTEMQTAIVTPLVEYPVDKKMMRTCEFGTDAVSRSDGGKPSCLFDGIFNNTAVSALYWPWITAPSWISLDLGKSYILSSFTLWNRFNSGFNLGSPRTFEIWGSNNPNPDEVVLPAGQQQIMDPSWFLIGRFETLKPSGNTGGTTTAADNAYANEGFHFMFPAEYTTDVPGSQEVRYVRLYVYSTWSIPMESLRISELSFWGLPLTK